MPTSGVGFAEDSPAPFHEERRRVRYLEGQALSLEQNRFITFLFWTFFSLVVSALVVSHAELGDCGCRMRDVRRDERK
jgi:hypothetical protein